MTVALGILIWSAVGLAPFYGLLGLVVLGAKSDELKARAMRANAEAVATDRASRLASPPTIRAVD